MILRNFFGLRLFGFKLNDRNMNYPNRTFEIRTKFVPNPTKPVWNQFRIQKYNAKPVWSWYRTSYFQVVLNPNFMFSLTFIVYGTNRTSEIRTMYLVWISDVDPNDLKNEPNQKAPKSERLDFGRLLYASIFYL